MVDDLARLAPTLAPLVRDATGVEIRAALDRLSLLGFLFVQLSAVQPGFRPRDLDRSARRDLLATLRRKSMTICGLDAWIPVAHFTDPIHVDRAVTAVQQTIELAADLGRCPVSIVFPPGASSSSMEHVLSHADRFGLRLADHAIPVQALTSTDLLGIGIDPAAWLSQGEDPVSAVHANATKLVSARLCDLLRSGMRGPIGTPQESRLDVLAYKIALSIAEFKHAIVVDARQWIDPWQGLQQTRAAWNAVGGIDSL
jgi:sugar phosphate isomerase/epimerase